MKSLISHPRLWTARQRLMVFVGVPIAALLMVAISAGSVSSPPFIQPIALSSDPLYATTSGDKPALALALSVEYPTVGAQYTTQNGATDNSYANTNEYLGYYDAEACYTYLDKPTETPVAPLTASDYKRFVRQGKATSRMCNDGFSGNFLNWASNSAIDMLRLALSGGDRSVDQDGLTILQRAFIPNGNPICMWNSQNFPPKQLPLSGGGASNPYWGAVPQAMITAAAGQDIYVANTLNQIYFGTAIAGSCGNTASYNLSVIPQVSTNGAITSFTGPLPSDASASCAGENQTCNFTGAREVWYGANNSWKYTQATNGISCSNGVFGDPLVGTVKACYTRASNASVTAPTAPSTGLNSDGFFYSRVQVCDKDSSGNLADVRDYGLCTKYPSGNYKPTGVIQTYSNQLRLAAFGYLLDQTDSGDGTNPPGRYGGVLRAPMTYVGPTTYDVNGIDNTPVGGNPKAEWSTQTGVYNVNPENDTTFNKSGVLTYLNQFGRTGVPGIYKIYDPVSELYYETLRYLQGLQPSTLAVQNIMIDMYDGFPVTTTYVDPYANRSATGSYSCLKSNIVVIGDINTHDGNRFPATDVANNIPNLGYWTGIVDSYERGSPTSYVDGFGIPQNNMLNPNPANSNPRGDAIIGYAYWAHMHDIRGTDWTGQPSMQRPGLRVKSFLFDVNEYGAGSVASNRQYNNQFFTAAKYGGYESDPANASSAPYNIHGNPFQQQDGTYNNNVWQNPATPGEASSYYLQSSARGVLSAFNDIFSRASTAARSIAGAAVTSKQLTQGGSTVYQAAFDTSNWSGDLFAFPLTIDPSTGLVTLGTTTLWSASYQLSRMPSPATTRNIVVGVPGSNSNSPIATDFEAGAITTVLEGQLNQLPNAQPDGLGAQRLAFLRGSNANEGSPFRQRNNKLLGDIINSAVVYSGAPSTTITSNTYAAFQTANANRTTAVFVGANDGMLHAFDATSGVELFGYIPSWMGPKLSALTDPNYLTNHQAYVDGPPVVAEAQVGNSNTSADWHTVLVSGTGAGGRGVFALDVTDPTAFSASKVMWEFTADDDVDMGFVVGQPQIVKIRTSAASVSPSYKWYAVVASGVNNYTQANTSGAFGSGNPAIFLLDLAHVTGQAWVQGTDYFKVSFPVDATLAQTHATGMLNFKVTISVDGSQSMTRLYAGDLHGNMWKLDFRPWGTANWDLAHLTAFTNPATTQPMPLFIAKDSLGNVQPISMSPTLVTSTTNPNGIQVAFGTGKYLEVSDSASTAVNSFYVINDTGSTTPDSNPAGAAIISDRGRLQQGTIVAGTTTTPGTVTVPTFVWGRATSDSDTTQRSGWYVDLPTSGERQVSGASLGGNTLVFGSLIPGTSGNAAACGVSGGSGNEYVVNVDTGSGSTNVSTVGILGPPLVVNLGSVNYSGGNTLGQRNKTTTTQIIIQGSTGTSGGTNTASNSNGGKSTTNTQQFQTTTSVGVLSWRQINNYLNLKNSPP